MSHRRRLPDEPKPDILPVLDALDIAFRADHRGWQPVRCPSLTHEDAQASCSLNLDEGALACHSCDFRGDVYTLWMEVKGVGFAEAKAAIGALDPTAGGLRVDGRATGHGSRPGYRPKFKRASPASLRAKRHLGGAV